MQAPSVPSPASSSQSRLARKCWSSPPTHTHTFPPPSPSAAAPPPGSAPSALAPLSPPRGGGSRAGLVPLSVPAPHPPGPTGVLAAMQQLARVTALGAHVPHQQQDTPRSPSPGGGAASMLQAPCTGHYPEREEAGSAWLPGNVVPEGLGAVLFCPTRAPGVPQPGCRSRS